jgi:hypothetical protein
VIVFDPSVGCRNWRYLMKITDFVLPGAKATITYAERLLAGVSGEIFARKPSVSGTRVDINHPAFIFGHLSTYPVQIAEMLELDTASMAVPPKYFEQFKAGCPCHDDTEGTIYPSMSELTERYFSTYRALLAALPGAREELYAKELTEPSRRERFGTVGAFTTYILLAHPQSHLGQMSGWRRCMGLGPA